MTIKAQFTPTPPGHYGREEEDFEERRRRVLVHGLSHEQLDGLACAYCGGRGGSMRPIGYTGPPGHKASWQPEPGRQQVFIHVDPCFR
jgi:hypothetical protein